MNKQNVSALRLTLRTLDRVCSSGRAAAIAVKSKDTHTKHESIPHIWRSQLISIARTQSLSPSDAIEYANLIANIKQHRDLLTDMGLGDVQVSVRTTLQRTAAVVGLSLPSEFNEANNPPSDDGKAKKAE